MSHQVAQNRPAYFCFESQSRLSGCFQACAFWFHQSKKEEKTRENENGGKGISGGSSLEKGSEGIWEDLDGAQAGGCSDGHGEAVNGNVLVRERVGGLSFGR